MLNRTPMPRGTGFKRPLYQRPPPSKPTKALRGVRAVIEQTVIAQPKENAVYSEPYRRLVAAMPCRYCGVQGYSQAAHPPPTAKGRKEDDRTTFALCSTRPGVLGCHVAFDQYKLFHRADVDVMANRWGTETRAEILAAGQWPKNLPLWDEDD